MSGKSRRGGLGRGLGALIPTSDPAAADAASGDETGRGQSATPDPRPAPDAPAAAGEAPHGPAPSAQATRTGPDASTAARSPHGSDGVPPGGQASGDSASGEPADPRAAVPGAQLAEIPVAAIRANTRQPRQVFDDEALAELTHSIREFGVLQPIVVRRDEAGGADYELVMGERRLRAAMAAGLDAVPAIVRTTADDAMLRDALLENIHRVALNPLEEAAAYQQLLQEFGTTHEELAQRLGRSRPQVSNTVRLLNLPVAVQRRVAAGVLSAGHARALLGLDDRSRQDDLAARIVAEGLSVRATEELVALAGRDDGADDTPRRRPASVRFTAPAVGQLADDLSDAFDTRVRVDLGRRKGRITVEFASIDDLERIIAVMAPQVAATRRGEAGTAPAPVAEA